MGDVNTRRTNSNDFDTEKEIVHSSVKCILTPLLAAGGEVAVFVDAVFQKDAEITQWYRQLWSNAIQDRCRLKIKVRKRLSKSTQKMGVVESLEGACAVKYDYTIVTRNNMIWKMPIPFSADSIGNRIGLLSYNTPDFGTTRSGRKASLGMWHDYLRVEDKYIIVPQCRLTELKEWLTMHSDNVNVTQGMHDLSSPICGLNDLVVIWPLSLSSNTSLMENPIYTLSGRTVGRSDVDNILCEPQWSVAFWK